MERWLDDKEKETTKFPRWTFYFNFYSVCSLIINTHSKPSESRHDFQPTEDSINNMKAFSRLLLYLGNKYHKDKHGSFLCLIMSS